MMLFLSIKPRYVRKILNGDKLVELRKQKPRSNAGDWIAIYESSPTMALVAVAQVAEVNVLPPKRLWRSVQSTAGITKAEFDNYFNNCENAVGIVLQAVTELPAPVSLNDLRERWPNFHPPQGFRYLGKTESCFVLSKIPKKLRQAAAKRIGFRTPFY
jgi:predicted transcriptional regulator